MFEQSLIGSAKQQQSGRRRAMVAASLAVQAAVVAAFIAVPLMWPAVLPVVIAAPRAAMVTLPKPSVKVEQPKPAETHITNTSALRTPTATTTTVATVRGGGIISRGAIPSNSPDEAPSLATGNGMGSSFSSGTGISNLGSSAVSVVQAVPAKPAGPLRISSGVLAGLLLQPIHPDYPPMAKAAGVQGTVVLSAVIDKTGHITGLQIVSGPEMLRRSALEAVQMAHYQPFQLNGAPTEVTTTISVVFRMQS